MSVYLDFNDAPDQSATPERHNIDDLRARLLSRLPEVLHYLFPAGQIMGNQFYIGNIRGDKGDSLVFTLEGDKAGLWHDFATGEGGDLIAAWAYYHNLDIKTRFPEVIESISTWLGVVPTKPYAVPIVKRQAVDDLGPHTAKWDYLDADGKLIACVYRYDTATGKQFRPWDSTARKIQAPNPRPLYNQPGMVNESTIVLVEGEKCADALINIGICATTAMMWANAPIDKTDWSPLTGKHVIIWSDNDEAGKAYAERAAGKLATQGVASIATLTIPDDKPDKWDAADAVNDGINIHDFLAEATQQSAFGASDVSAFTMRELIEDPSPMPEDIIAPRILTPAGMLVFGGAPKVGKSDFLLSLLVHMAAGEPFLSFTPPKPLKVFYLQAEIQYHYLRERLKQIKLPDAVLRQAQDQLVMTPQLKLILNDEGVGVIGNLIREHFPNGLDILVIDPIRNVFDGGEAGASENDNNAMLFFLRQRVEKLRDGIDPDSGIILVHHTKKTE